MARKVLIVEDDAGVRAGLARLLRGVGFEVTSAATVGEGLAALDGQDIAVIDLRLPDAPGTVLLRKIRRENRRIRAAVWTADPDGVPPADRHDTPEPVFRKPRVDELLEWLGQP